MAASVARAAVVHPCRSSVVGGREDFATHAQQVSASLPVGRWRAAQGSTSTPRGDFFASRLGRAVDRAVPCCRSRRCRSIFAVAALAAPPRGGNLQDLLADAQERTRRALVKSKEEGDGAGFSYDDFREALGKFDFSFELGDVVKGVVFRTDHTGALIDIGAKATAFMPLQEASIEKVRSVEELGLTPGTEGEFMIIRDDDPDGVLILSLRAIQYNAAWEKCKQCLEDDTTVMGKVIAVNRGGILVSIDGLRGFVPSSHCAMRTQREDLVDQEIPLKFLEVDEERTRLVLSNRRAMAENQLDSFKVGDVVVGTVQTVKPYGAFIDIGGGLNGLLHISQISHDRITNVETVLSEGDELKVMILSQDKERGRISLSTKKLEPTPGDMLRNPSLVYEKADEMAKTFRERVAAAEAAAKAEELRLQTEGYGLLDDLGADLGLDDLDLDYVPLTGTE
ncbi:hypothetical protein CBR_g34276 [Chara braunii]|uniref:S1 motif domain-containing protein n=1 Tax=Chara braunii TaxID=69332 RepID=A0A388JYL7_CHABU|nr:hypothetical protein CBR_g34276 [Chara braunii]|eukprot:GBG62904.1 hypothetical protein CBR_g34276 [Chara braunii]